MNRHFERDADVYDVPRHAYGRVDHVELAAGGTTALLAIDLVDATWLRARARRDQRFDLDDPQAMAAAWQSWTPAGSASPFEDALLYRLEVDLPWPGSWFGFPPLPDPRDAFAWGAAMAALERAWFAFDVFPTPAAEYAANLYPSLFANALPVWTNGTLVTAQQGKALSGLFSLAHLPAISTRDFALRLAHADAGLLAAFDVGQGSANALLSDRQSSKPVPTLYYDLGAGVYRNRRTTPAQLVFCFADADTIVLSHWDADHWAGTYATRVNGDYPARQRSWIAPFQTVGPVHVAFAHEVVSHGGAFHTWSVAAGTVGIASLPHGREIRFTLGTGRDRNGSGIVFAVEDAGQPTPCSWLLTGDCDYLHFAAALAPLPPVAVVVPHHGADLAPSSPVPAPAPGTYRRLVYSFGPDNRHGSTGVQHPTSGGVAAHDAAGWGRGAWPAATPGTPMPGPDLLATGEHAPGTARGGALVGWTSAPARFQANCGQNAGRTTPTQAACGGLACSTVPTQA